MGKVEKVEKAQEKEKASNANTNCTCTTPSRYPRSAHHKQIRPLESSSRSHWLLLAKCPWNAKFYKILLVCGP